jgi:hypothetical protein
MSCRNREIDAAEHRYLNFAIRRHCPHVSINSSPINFSLPLRGITRYESVRVIVRSFRHLGLELSNSSTYTVPASARSFHSPRILRIPKLQDMNWLNFLKQPIRRDQPIRLTQVLYRSYSVRIQGRTRHL